MTRYVTNGEVMENSDFAALATKCTKKTPNVRVYSGAWDHAGTHRIPNEVAEKIGAMIALIQTQIELELLCKKEEHLLIYNFQILSNESYLYCLDMLIKPISDLNSTSVKEGRPLQLVINAVTKEIMNNAQGMMIMASEMEIDIGDLSDDLNGDDKPITYGCYDDNDKELSNEGQSESASAEDNNSFLLVKNLEAVQNLLSASPQEIEPSTPPVNSRNDSPNLCFLNPLPKKTWTHYYFEHVVLEPAVR